MYYHILTTDIGAKSYLTGIKSKRFSSKRLALQDLIAFNDTKTGHRAFEIIEVDDSHAARSVYKIMPDGEVVTDL